MLEGGPGSVTGLCGATATGLDGSMSSNVSRSTELCLCPIMAAPCHPAAGESRGATPLDDMPHAAEGRKAAARALRMEQER